MSTEKTFVTKTGFCQILPDRIVLSRDGIAGNATRSVKGNSTYRTLLLYSLICCSFAYIAYSQYVLGKASQSLVTVALAAYLAYAVLSSLTNSAANVIERSSIRSVSYKKAIPGLTRGRFEILFTDEKGKLKKRLVLLPGSIAGSKKETEQALQIMKEEGLL